MARTKKKSKGSELAAQTDPQAPLDSAAFLKAAQPVLELLTRDLLTRADASEGITAALKVRHAVEVKEKLTADAYDQWRRQIVVQIAAGWLLSCVFVRTLEDRGLLPHNRIAGPGATDAQHTFFSIAPYLTERDYLRAVFTELEHVPACKELFDREHNLTWRLAPSAEATKELLGLFRMPDAAAPGFRFGQSSTRFLGDLYQDLSEDVRKRFALLQTPDFIESFILDRTLEPAVEEFGLGDTTVIDPTCGSGHFLLGAFERLFQRWSLEEPGEPVASAVGKALESVYGVDVNPYAVSIARFRLTLAAVEKLGGAQISGKISGVPRLPLHVVVADSLLHGFAGGQGDFGELEGESVAAWKGEQFAIADEPEAKAVLKRGYAAVVGNPPYITVKDEALRERYRKMYAAANGKYALSAPFMERFFALAREGGFVGQITANSFMKREFGKGLVEKVLPAVDVELIVNTAGAYIPGHGTPTVLVFGRNRRPVSAWVQAVLARRGEPSTPEVAAEGVVWGSIRDHWGEEGFENEYVTVERVEREKLGRHPWSLEGGGAGELKAILEERCERRLGDVAESIGFASFTGMDDVFILPRRVPQRHGIPERLVRDMVMGEDVRDWATNPGEVAICPYDRETHQPLPLDVDPAFVRFMWPYRTVLGNVASFGGKTRGEEGQDWWAWYRWQSERYVVQYRITFAFVATHNHFVLDRGGKVFKQTAPIIKLPATATEDDHLALLAYLNSSTACFWMKQVSVVKGLNHGSEANATDYLAAYEFDGTKLRAIPVPDFGDRRAQAIQLAKDLEAVQRRRRLMVPTIDELKTCTAAADVRAILDRLESERLALLEIGIALQEEIDWLVYEAFGITGLQALTPAEARGVSLGARPFEIALSSREDDPACEGWFRWHGSVPATRLADGLSQLQRRIYQARLELLQSADVGVLRLLESPLCKRRWTQVAGKAGQSLETDRKQVEDAALAALEHYLESWASQETLPFRDIEMIRAAADPWCTGLVDVAQGAENNIASFVRQFLTRNSVPFSDRQVLSASGLEKLHAWERTWEAQDAADREAVEGRSGSGGTADVPPKFSDDDFRSVDWYRQRGRLNVPRERFIAYPDCGSRNDPGTLYAWAGATSSQRAQMLATIYVARKNEDAWEAAPLRDLLQGLKQLIPGLKRWDNAPSPDLGQGLGDFYEQWVDEEMRALTALVSNSSQANEGSAHD